MKNINPLQELDTSPDSEFAKAVDFVVSTPVADEIMFDEVVLGYTPLVFRMIDDKIPLKPMETDLITIEKVMAFNLGREERIDKSDRTPHNIDPETLKQFPAQLIDPIAIIKSQTKINGYVVLTELFEKEHNKYNNVQQRPIVVAIHLKWKNDNKNQRKRYKHLKITTGNGRKVGFIINNLTSNLLMYLNREKCRHLFLNYLITPSARRQLNKDNQKDDNERMQIIAELCGLEMHKGRYQLKTTATFAAREISHQTENDHLYDANNTQKPTIMQAIKQKISPKQAKRSIPMPTGYKTEEDLQQFYQEIMQKPLTKEQAKLVGRDMISQVEPMNHIEFIEHFNNHIEKVYNNGGDTNIQSIQNCIQQMVKKIPDILKAQQAQTQTQPEKNQSKEKGDGGRER
ncbi:MAG: hypothetical protein J6M43_08925 [Neisseriaceae bacterium]|nr:hypothetical protein [Neisseriaceae bacterium]